MKLLDEGAVVGLPDLLNLKILSYLRRKKDTDARDIIFIVQKMAEKNIETSRSVVTHASDNFLNSFVTLKIASSKPYWVAIGLVPP